ncbi:hypothetical protein PAT3040_02604 [Paenibacillus agaridevorans]|uniref:Uncharacterized protein n=1 Tax=Paenibacillus agaridevorans TaxID=171404 RepID=A0A2R5EN95_9BACL|nr:hypothetical protein [Paenibacillus agaridevorans]GBG08037.1 hypothetical protein PAT3040_02604 [Paenibacillus agaridevorans]
MEHVFTIEPSAYTTFDNESELLEKGKEWGLISEKAAKMKVLAYKRDGKSLSCEIVGYTDKVTAVIRFENGQLHSIHPSYLKEMQAASFGGKAPAAVESAEEAALQADSVVAVQAESEAVDTATADAPPWDTDAADNARASEPSSLPATPKPDAPAKKSKKEKIELPDGKVSVTATVQEFTTVPNHFSDNDDEVIIYEAVTISEPLLELGSAWSSHSATLKKLELAVGDTITFEAKLVPKKLTKHPVPYKINNPAKIQKV